MKILAVNAFNDLYAVNGQLPVLTEKAAIAQRCTHAMSTLRGEMQYAADEGMPLMEVAWSGSPNMLAFEASARARLRSIEGVAEVLGFAAQVSDNVLRYTASIRTIYGVAAINGSL